MDDGRKTLTVPEVARELGIGINAAYEGVKRGVIPHIKIGARIVVPKAAFERFLAEAGRGSGAQG